MVLCRIRVALYVQRPTKAQVRGICVHYFFGWQRSNRASICPCSLISSTFAGPLSTGDSTGCDSHSLMLGSPSAFWSSHLMLLVQKRANGIPSENETHTLQNDRNLSLKTHLLSFRVFRRIARAIPRTLVILRGAM
jgi:hypothetical protein